MITFLPSGLGVSVSTTDNCFFPAIATARILKPPCISSMITDCTDCPLSSGHDQLRVCGRWRVEDAALQDAAEEVEALVTAVGPVAELVEVGLQVRGADAVEDVELPALEVGDDDVRPRQQLAGGLRRGLCGRFVQVTGAGQRPVG